MQSHVSHFCIFFSPSVRAKAKNSKTTKGPCMIFGSWSGKGGGMTPTGGLRSVRGGDVQEKGLFQ